MNLSGKQLLYWSSVTLNLALVPLVQGAEGHGDDHQFSIRTRAIHFDRQFERSALDLKQSALAVQLNYRSPHYSDWIGVGLSGSVVQKLEASGHQREDLLTFDDGKVQGFEQLGQAYVTLTPNRQLSVKLGRQIHKSMLINSYPGRTVPSSFEGISGQYRPSAEWLVHGAVYHRWSRQWRGRFEGFATDNSEEGAIDYIGLVGARYQHDRWKAEFEFLNMKDYLGKTGIRLRYEQPLKDARLVYRGGVFATFDNGDLFIAGAESDLDDEDASGKVGNSGLGAFVDLALTKGRVEYSLAVAKFGDAWINDNYAGDLGGNPFPASGVGSDLTSANETSARLQLKVDWQNYLPGLETRFAVAKGWHAENSEDPALGSAEEDWQIIDVSYRPSWLKGLQFKCLWLNHNRNTQGKVDGVKMDRQEVRMFADYTIRF